MKASPEEPSDGTAAASADAVTSELWGRKAREKVESDDWRYFYWQSHPVTTRHINRLITGDPDEGWLSFTKRRFLSEELDRGLSLGCGSGRLEREAIALGICRTFDAFDISEEALEAAAGAAEQAGVGEQIDYRQADLNAVRLAPAAYDIVFAIQALHHVDALEYLLDEVRRSLRSGGLFVVNEYIGPARFQWLDKTQAIMNRLLELLPHEYKVNPRNGFVKERIDRAPAEEISRVDPSESIRSDEIVATLESRFEVRYRADFGGTLLQFVLADIAANFREDDPKDVALLDLMSLVEEILVAERVLPSDFAFFVLSPRR
jgi:SAM-dependent methyltransferase